MTHIHNPAGRNRRGFLKEIAGSSAAFLFAGGVQGALAQGSPDWRKQVGLELYTVRDLLAKDFEGTLAKVAEIGYTEIEPIGYGGLDPKKFRALLDSLKLSAPSTHTSAAEGPDLEKELEGHQIMGFKYTQISGPRRERGTRPARTEEWAKRAAERYNRQGALAAKFGMKILIHNHAGEFETLENSTLTQYDVLLAETNPVVVAMQIDIAWASVAGKDVLEMFRKHPGRYELWHVKDVLDLNKIDTSVPAGKREPTFIPVGQGSIDYKPIFASAGLAGLKHYVIEQDNAGEKGADSMAAARANYQGLVKVLS